MSKQEPEKQGWIGITTESLSIRNKLSKKLLKDIYEEDLNGEISPIPAEDNSHFTVIYGLKKEGISRAATKTLSRLPNKVKIIKLEVFEQENYNIIVGLLEKTKRIEEIRESVIAEPHYEQQFEDYKPHITFCYLKKDGDLNSYVEILKQFENTEVNVTGISVDNPWAELKTMKEEDGTK